MHRHAVLFVVLLAHILGCAPGREPVPPYPSSWAWDPFLDTLQTRTLAFFLETTPRETGLSPDRWPTPSPSSVAAVGFALTCYPIAVERGLVARAEAAERTLATLRFLYALPQSTDATNTAGYRGFYYHFIDMKTGRRAWNCELSTIDTGLLMAGVLFAQSYYDGTAPAEREIRAIADSLYRRVDWAWFAGGGVGLRTAWFPDRGFSGNTWTGYNEAMILYILAMGSPTHPAPDWFWSHWTGKYVWGEYFGSEFISFGPIFGHQYSHCWIDYRGIKDRYMWGRGIDYFENSRRATYTHRAYGEENPQGFRDYSRDIWGWTASDGPKDTAFSVDGRTRRFWSYRARGVSLDWVEDDGTLAPTAAGGSVAFAPEICVPALKAMRLRYGDRLFRGYGFADAFNPTYATPATDGGGWVGTDYLGIDQGPIAVMVENLRNGFVWNIMKRNPYVVNGLRRAGFSGGWLDTLRAP